MKNMDRQAAGAVAGLIATVVPAWARWDDDNRRRLNQTRDTVNSVSQQLTDLNSSGTMIRLRIPAVMDLITGFGLANPMTLFASPLPSNVPRHRPEIFFDAATAVADYSWPPTVGDYDDKGNTAEPGDLATLGLALTFEEVRAALIGFVQERQPNRHQKLQIFNAVNALVATLYKTSLTFQQFADIWAKLFGGASGSVNDPHHNPLTPPTIQSMGPGISSVIPLGTPDLAGYQYAHVNSDAAMKFRLTAGAAVVPSLTTLFSVQFGSAYSRNGQPYQPVPTLTYSPFFVVNITNAGFQVQNLTALAPGSVVDFGCSVAAT